MTNVNSDLLYTSHRETFVRWTRGHRITQVKGGEYDYFL